MMVYICTKFHENILNGIGVMTVSLLSLYSLYLLRKSFKFKYRLQQNTIPSNDIFPFPKATLFSCAKDRLGIGWVKILYSYSIFTHRTSKVNLLEQFH